MRRAAFITAGVILLSLYLVAASVCEIPHC